MYINIIGCLEWPALCRSCTASQMCYGQFCWLEHPKLFFAIVCGFTCVLWVTFCSFRAALRQHWTTMLPPPCITKIQVCSAFSASHMAQGAFFSPQKSWSFVDSTSFLKCWGPHGSFIKETWTQIWGKCKDFCRFCCKWWLLLTFLVQ